MNNLKTGAWKYCRENGSLSKTITFSLGVKEGKQTDYYKSENIESVFRYKKGRLNSIIQLFDENDSLIFNEDTSEAAVYYFTDEEAIFLGGEKGLSLFIKDGLSDFKKSNTKMYISFNVDKKGTVTEIAINKLTNQNTPDKELKKAFKLIAKMPQWEPAMKRGRVVKSRRLIKIEF